MIPSEIETTPLGDRIFHYGEYEMWVPFDGLAKIIERYSIDPTLGAGECGFEAFCDYLSLLPSSRYLGPKGDNIESLVGMFDEDLHTFAKISEQHKTKKGK